MLFNSLSNKKVLKALLILYLINAYITQKIIDTLISLAERKPFCHFVHFFGEDIECLQNMDYLEFISNKKYESLPKNLTFHKSPNWNHWF